jgi:hypothetical protein
MAILYFLKFETPPTCIYFPQEQGSPVISPGIWFTFVYHCQMGVILRLTVSRPVCPDVRAPSGAQDQFLFFLEIILRQLLVIMGTLADERMGV